MKTLTTLALLLALSTPLLAHGGGHASPAPPPPTLNPPSAAPAGAAAGARGASTRPGSAPGTVGSSPWATTSAGFSAINAGSSGWEIWWRLNQDRFLSIKQRLDRATPDSGGNSRLTGAGQRVRTRRRVSAGEIEIGLLPTLLEIITEEDENVLLDSALVAIARVTPESSLDTVQAAIATRLDHNDLNVQSAATLALGLLGAPDSGLLLRDILLANSAGRNATGGGEPPWLVRAFAALALGLVGDELARRTLMDTVSRLPDSEREIKTCAIVGLGLSGRSPDGAHPDVVAFLVEQLDDPRLDAFIASHVPTALARLGARTVSDRLLEIVGDGRSDNLLRQSSVLALGELATPAETVLVRALIREVEHGKDVLTRHFALVALGQIAGRADPARDGDRGGTSVDAIGALLAEELAGKGKSREHQAWAALATALASQGQAGMPGRLLDRLRNGYAEAADASVRGAFALSLGLVGDHDTAPAIFRDLGETADDSFRVPAALALGFLGFDEARPLLQTYCRDRTAAPTLRQDAAVALGLMGDAEIGALLVELLDGEDKSGVTMVLARALGTVGGREALGPLVSLALDDTRPVIARAFACVALGLVAERTDLPFNEPMRANLNYGATGDALYRVLSIL